MPVPTPIALEDPAIPAAMPDDPAATAPEVSVPAIDAIVKRLVHPLAVDENGLAEAGIAAAAGMVEGEARTVTRPGADAVGAVEGRPRHADADAHADSGGGRRGKGEATAQGCAAKRSKADGKLMDRSHFMQFLWLCAHSRARDNAQEPLFGSSLAENLLKRWLWYGRAAAPRSGPRNAPAGCSSVRPSSCHGSVAPR